jgi:hypothetical protein
LDIHTNHPMTKTHTQSLDVNQQAERVKRCTEKNLCYISLKSLEGEKTATIGGRVVLAKYATE